MKLAIGSDHGGYDLKEYLIKYLVKNKISFKDFGCFNHDSIDYPDIAYPVAKAVAAKKFTYGILVCGTGIGMCMSANKLKKIRAALCHNVYTAGMTREHNDANLLCLGGRVVTNKQGLEILKTFLKTKFAGGRHLQRIKKIAKG